MTAQIIHLSAYREPVRYRIETGQMFRLNELYARVMNAKENDWYWCDVKSRDGARHYQTWVHLSDLRPLRNDADDARQAYLDAYVAAYVFGKRKLRNDDRPSDTEEA